MMLKSIFTSSFLLCGLLAFANTQPKSKSAQMHARCMDHISKWNKELALATTDSLLHIAKVENDSFYIGQAYEIKGELAYYDGDFEGCKKFSYKNLTLQQALKNFDLMALINARLGNIHRHQGNLDSSFSYAYKAKSLIPFAENQTKCKINIYNDLGLLFTETGDLDSSIFYQLQLLELIPAKDSGFLHAANYNLARSFEMLQNNVKQKEYLDRALSYCQGKRFLGSKAKVMAMLASYWLEEGEIEKAYALITESIEIQETNNKKDKIERSYIIYASILLAQKNHIAAGNALDKISYLEKNDNLEKTHLYNLYRLLVAIAKDDQASINLYLPIAKKQVANLNQIKPKRFLSKVLADYYQSRKNYALSNKHLNEFIEYNDAVTNLANKQIASNMESEFGFEKNKLRIEGLEEKEMMAQKDLARQRNLLWTGGTALALISLLSFFLYTLFKKVTSQKNVISKTLLEKDTLLREIHHRVKNNLQLVSSLLTLQSRSITDKSAIAAINDGKARVRSMALIHQDLYNKENLTGISVKSYIEKLCNEIFHTYNINSENILLHTDIQDLELDVDIVVPLGLIINELITNSLKYAFPNNQKGDIFIALKENDNSLQLQIKDNGVGVDIDQFKQPSSFGNRLVNILTEQLEGTLRIHPNDGSFVELNISNYKKAA